MNTEAKTLHIRRGQPTDAVNIFRLIVDEEKRAKTSVALDDATRLSDIIATIATGYVSVAVTSGRIVGSIGALISASSGVNLLVGAWFALSSSFHDTPVGSALVSGLVKAAKDAGYPIRFTLPVRPSRTLVEALGEADFEPKMTVWGYEPSDHGQEPVEPPDEDRGSDALAGDAGSDDEPADPDAGADGQSASVA